MKEGEKLRPPLSPGRRTREDDGVLGLPQRGLQGGQHSAWRVISATRADPGPVGAARLVGQRQALPGATQPLGRGLGRARTVAGAEWGTGRGRRSAAQLQREAETEEEGERTRAVGCRVVPSRVHRGIQRDFRSRSGTGGIREDICYDVRVLHPSSKRQPFV